MPLTEDTTLENLNYDFETGLRYNLLFGQPYVGFYSAIEYHVREAPQLAFAFFESFLNATQCKPLCPAIVERCSDLAVYFMSEVFDNIKNRNEARDLQAFISTVHEFAVKYNRHDLKHVAYDIAISAAGQYDIPPTIPMPDSFDPKAHERAMTDMNDFIKRL